MVSVKDLRDMIRKHREAECPKISKMKKSDLMKYAEEKGLMKNAPMKEVKEKKPRANKVVHAAAEHNEPKNKKELIASIKKAAIEHIKEHPESKEFERIKYPHPSEGSEAILKLADGLHDEISLMKAKDAKESRLQGAMAKIAADIYSHHKNKLGIKKEQEKHKNVNVEDVMKKIEALRVKLSKAKTDSAQMAIEDEIDELKSLLPRKRFIKSSE